MHSPVSFPRSSAIFAAGVLALLVGLASPPSPARAAAFEIDPAHSSLGFSIRHVFTKVPGRFEKFGATLDFDEAAPEKSTIEFTIDATSVTTDVEKRDGHLKSADFFNVEKYPTLVFKSTKVEKTAEKNVYNVTGDFTMLGVTKPVTVRVEILGAGPDGRGGTQVGLEVSGTVNRKDFGMIWNKTLDQGNTLLGDDVKFQASIEAHKKTS
jgi:polyisoprenoid-binding protein YceI